MTEYNKAKYIKKKEDIEGLENTWNLKHHGHLVLEQQNISMEILKKIQDKRYEIDIEYEMSRDLYEK